MFDQDNQIDNMIREALDEEDRKVLEEVFGEPSLFDTVTAVFRGKLGWLSVFSIVAGIALMVIGVLALLRFVAIDDVPEMLRWGALFFFCLVAVMSMKIWHWMEIQRHALTREIKRLELQVARLGARLDAAG